MKKINLLNNIHVINLKKNNDRLSNISNNLKQYNVTFTRFDAVNGYNLDDNEINNRTSFLCRNLLCNRGMIGCASSHIALWKQLINDDKTDYYIVLEDDVEIDNTFIKIIKLIEENIKSNKLNFDYLNLHCTILGLNCYQYSHVLQLDDEYVIGKSLFPLTTASYIISKDCASKLVNLFDTINYHVDFEIALKSKLHNINYLTLNKKLTKTQEHNESTMNDFKVMSPIIMILKFFKLDFLAWLLYLPLFTIGMKYPINLMVILLILLTILNITKLKSPYITIYLLIEFVIYFAFLK